MAAAGVEAREDARVGALDPAPPAAPPAEARGAAPPHRLWAEPTGFAAFQAVRLLGRMQPGRAPVGGWADPAREVVRFAVPPTLAFPSAEVLALDPGAPNSDGGDGPPRLAVAFFGLVGPQGVLPQAYTQHAGARARARDPAFRDFVDLFQHRALSLFYRTWTQSKPVLGHEAGARDWLLDHLLDVAGLGTAGLRGRLAVPDAALGYYAGLLATAGRPAEGLARLVGDYFGVPAAVEQFVGEWRPVGGDGQCALGTDDDGARLGLGVLGDEAWDPEARVRLRLGPLSRADFDGFLPGGAAHAALRDLAGVYADAQVGVDAQLVLDRAAVAPVVLGDDAEPPTLGRGMWLVSRPLRRDPDETTFALC